MLVCKEVRETTLEGSTAGPPRGWDSSKATVLLGCLQGPTKSPRDGVKCWHIFEGRNYLSHYTAFSLGRVSFDASL